MDSNLDSLTIKLESEERHMMQEEDCRIRRNRGQSRDRKKMGEEEERIRRNRAGNFLMANIGINA